MIWTAETQASGPRDAVREHLRGHLHSHVGGRITHPGLLADVAAVVATAWQEDFQGAALPPDALSLMAARTMWGAGEVDAARALVDGMTGGGDMTQAWVELIEAGGPSLPACIGLGAGVLRPARTLVAGGGPCWALDASGLTAPSGYLAELDLPARLQRVLSRTAEIWDGSDGNGMLGIAPPSARVSAHLHWWVRTEAPGICRMVLDRLQSDRGWTRCPSVCRRGL